MTPAEYVTARASIHTLARLLRSECDRLGFRSEAVPAVLWYAEEFGTVQCGAAIGHNHETVRLALDELLKHVLIEPVAH